MMIMSALPAWSASAARETPSPSPDASDREPDARRQNTASPWLMLVPLGAAAISAAAVLLRKPAVRKACGDVVRDPEVREVCKDAGQQAYRVVATSWRRHGGPAGMAETFLR